MTPTHVRALLLLLSALVCLLGGTVDVEAGNNWHRPDVPTAIPVH